MKAILAAVAFAATVSAFGQVKVEQLTYHGWVGSYRLSNGTVDLIVVPQIGRVMRYGYLNGPNLLWENADAQGKPPVPGTWNNYGGDKTWPAPQSDWNWPPDPSIDGSAWTAEALPNGVRMTSPAGRQSHVQFVREITLHEIGTEVHFHNQMKNQGARHLMAPWQITQVADPYSVFLPIQSTPEMPAGWRLLTGSKIDPTAHHQEANGLRLSLSSVSYKFGAFSPTGEITASKGSTVFHVKTKTYPRLPYPDTGSALEVYLGAGANPYAELELLAPLTQMENGEMSVLDTSWTLTQGS